MNNLLSIFLGLLALGLPVVGLLRRKQKWLCCTASLSACALSLYFQLRELTRLVNKPDISAVLDTINAVCFCATALVILTLILNAMVTLRKER